MECARGHVVFVLGDRSNGTARSLVVSHCVGQDLSNTWINRLQNQDLFVTPTAPPSLRDGTIHQRFAKQHINHTSILNHQIAQNCDASNGGVTTLHALWICTRCVETTIGVVSMSFQTLGARFGSITEKKTVVSLARLGSFVLTQHHFEMPRACSCTFFLCFDGLRVKKCIGTPLHDASLGLRILRVLRLLRTHISFSDRQARRMDPDPKVDQTYLLRSHCG